MLQYLFSGVTVGGIYAIVAVGFNLIYGTTGILNFSQGEFVILGGMLAVTFSRVMPLWLAVALATFVTGGIGALLEFAIFRRLRKHTLMQMIVITIGLSIVLQEIMLHVWDEKVRALPYFTGDECSSVQFCGAAISPQVFWVLATVTIAVILLQQFLGRTMAGKCMRACASNPEAAMLAGINIFNMRALAFFLSAALGAFGGCMISPITMTRYDMGTGLAIKGFAAAILGGLGNPLAGILGGLLVGVAEAFSVRILPAAYQDVTAFTILLLILFIRPQGILGGAASSRIRDC